MELTFLIFLVEFLIHFSSFDVLPFSDFDCIELQILKSKQKHDKHLYHRASSPHHQYMPFYSAGLLGAVFYAGLFTFGFNRIIEKLYAWSNGSMVYKVQFYVYLLNFPMIVLILSGVIYNGSLVPLNVALTLDQIYILAISGYICYVEQSRQTPLRGFVFIKDLFFILSCLGLYMALNANSQNTTTYIVVVIFLYIFNLITQAFANELEHSVLLLLGIRQKNVYSACFLLTEKSQS